MIYFFKKSLFILLRNTNIPIWFLLYNNSNNTSNSNSNSNNNNNNSNSISNKRSKKKTCMYICKIACTACSVSTIIKKHTHSSVHYTPIVFLHNQPGMAQQDIKCTWGFCCCLDVDFGYLGLQVHVLGIMLAYLFSAHTTVLISHR